MTLIMLWYIVYDSIEVKIKILRENRATVNVCKLKL